MENEQQQQGLYEKAFEHDACGVGLVANLDNVATREVVVDGLTVLKRLMHRGATGNDPETGDGAGLLLQIPDGFFRKNINNLPEKGNYAIAMVFGAEKEEKTLEAIAAENGVKALCWREVPTDPSAIGQTARETMPKIRQLFLKSGDERKLYVIRREMEKALKNGYICSLSSRTVVYKGLLLAPQVEKFYPDLADADFISTIALVHQRYSTNTFPTWDLAHPFRMLAHNGEINTLKGNINALKAREKDLSSPVFGDEIKKLLPLIREGQSDSASLDNMFELLVAAGRDPAHAMLMLMPQAWGQKYHMGHDVRGFYEYHSALMEPWDGPAAVAFTDGITAGAALDRNGLRPARWTLTRNHLFILASETGVIDVPAEEVVRHGRLKPGSMVYLDLPNHRLMDDSEIKVKYARRKPYRRWVDENRIAIQGLFTEIVPPAVGSDLSVRQKTFGYTDEDLEIILNPMAKDGKEPVGSMGNDAALACLSKNPRTLFDYFHQVFAQVTNPPIDPIREELVMSLMTYIGNKGNILEETPEHANLIKLRRPVLTEDELARIEASCSEKFPTRTLPIFFEGDLEVALEQIGSQAVSAVGSGAKIIVLSDKPELNTGHTAAIPSLLATAAVNRALIDAGIRSSVGLIIQTGEVREVHHYAVLLGFGATAINPYLALESVCALFPKDPVTAASNYIKAVDKGLLKIMSKMGISTLRSYRSAQMFECVGLAKNVIEKCFPGTPSRVGGLDFAALEKKIAHDHSSLIASPCRRTLPLPQGRGGPPLDAVRAQQLPSRRPRQRLCEVQGLHGRDRRPDEPQLHATRTLPLQAHDRHPGRGSRIGRIHHEALRRRRDVPRLALARSPHRHRPRLQLDRLDVELRRRRRELGALRHGRQLRHQAGRLRPLRRDDRIPPRGEGPPDQARPGREARRRRTAPGAQGQRVRRQAPPCASGHDPHLPAAAP